MVIGTAQFGSSYGITNEGYKPNKKDIFSILEFACNKGIYSFDTAPDYKTEKILGEFIKVNGLNSKVKISTKVPTFDKFSQRDHLKVNIEKSIKNLGCSVEVLFLHNAKDSSSILDKPDYYLDLMKEFPISNIGVSVYDPEEVLILDNSIIDLSFQFPYNILDRRFKDLEFNKSKRYARSIFLQGLLVNSNGIKLKSSKSLRELHLKYHTLLSRYNINPLAFALSFIYQSNDIDYFLIGLESLEHLSEILKIEYDKDFNKHYEKVKNFKFNDSLLDPRKWNQN